MSEKQLNDKYKTFDAIENWVHYCNNQRLHASLKYLRLVDYLLGRSKELLEKRRKKLKEASKKRRKENLRFFLKKDVKEQKVGALTPHPQDLSPFAGTRKAGSGQQADYALHRTLRRSGSVPATLSF